MPNIPLSGAYDPTTETLGQIKARIARSIQGASQANALGEAGDALADAVRWWNRREWKLLLTEAPTQAVSASVTDYPLPSDIKKIYDVRLVNRPLSFATQRDWDRSVWNQGGASEPSHYVVFLMGSSRKIRLIPTPAATDTLTVRYYKRLELPTDENTQLGWPNTWVEPIVNYAKALLTLDRKDNRARDFMALARAGFAEAKADDLYQPDEVVGLKRTRYSHQPDSAWFYVKRHYGK